MHNIFKFTLMRNAFRSPAQCINVPHKLSQLEHSALSLQTQFGLSRSLHAGNALFKKRKSAELAEAIQQPAPVKPKKNLPTVNVWRNMSVRQLAKSMKRPIEDVQEALLFIPGCDNIEPSSRFGDMHLLHEVVKLCGCKSVIAPPVDLDDEELDSTERDVMPRPPARPEDMKPRPPVVTVMGHVDHGKTTLLDTLRGAAVAAGEAGGITQHIGAFTVTLESGEKVTFLDTPGHAAFTAMRARGASVTDIIVLVVAAEDGVMQQTREVINLAKESNVPIIVALNKIDKPEANIERSKQGLAQMGLVLEEHGGDVQLVPISALKGTNLDLLAEAITTQATMMGLQAEYSGLMEGIVVESRTDPKRGKLSTAIVSRGTLRKGSVLVSGVSHAKVRGLFDHNGVPMDCAEPGMPVEVLGWRELPQAGDIILEVETEKKAHVVLKYRESLQKQEKAESWKEDIDKSREEHTAAYRAERTARRLAGRYRKAAPPIRTKEVDPDAQKPRVNVIIKGDVHGSVEAILDVLETYDSNDQCRLSVVHYGVGPVTENDVELAKTFNAIIYAFSVDCLPNVNKKTANIRQVNIIYRLIDDLKEELNKQLPEIEVEEVIGTAEVLQQFFIDEGRKQEVPVAGSRCVKGVLKKAHKFRLMRDGEVILDGPLHSMRHLKDEVDTIKKGIDCGLRFKDVSVAPEPGDQIICYTTRPEKQKTDWNPGF